MRREKRSGLCLLMQVFPCYVFGNDALYAVGISSCNAFEAGVIGLFKKRGVEHRSFSVALLKLSLLNIDERHWLLRTGKTVFLTDFLYMGFSALLIAEQVEQ